MVKKRTTRKVRRPVRRAPARPRASEPMLPPDALVRAKRRFLELSSVVWSPARKVPAGLITALATIQQQGAPAGGPEIFVFVRKQQGTGCEQVAEIAGWYSQKLAPGQACIGQAAVLAALNTAAGNLCMATLKCPTVCPCQYVPRNQLASYTCANGVEDGFLLQGTHVWNCMCFGL